MKKIELREEQLIELEILKAFAAFCEENRLRYYLDSGPLLGAVRHQGFIPWDDDIDVCFLRKDYDRFVELMAKQDNRLNDHIVLELEKDSLYPYLKLVDTRTVLIEYPKNNPVETGIYIDIFPKDGLLSQGKNEQFRAKMVWNYHLLSWIRAFTVPKWERAGGLKNKLLATAVKILIPNGLKYKEKAIRLARKYSHMDCPYVSSIVCSGLGGCVEKECFGEGVDVTFEGHTFKAPANYDKYLRTLYRGDYMTPPPPEKRIAHETEVYWKD